MSQIALGIFRLVWNDFVIPNATPFAYNIFGVDRNLDVKANSYEIRFEIILSIFNNTVGPIVATMFTSSNCFYYVLNNPSDIKTSFQYSFCPLSGVKGGCLKGGLLVYDKTISFQAPFIYSYQCAATIVRTYISVYLFSNFFSSLTIICSVILKYYQQHLDDQSTQSKWINIVLPRLLRVYPTEVQTDDIPKLFDKKKFIVNLLTQVAIIFSFGLMYPPLAFFYIFAFYRDNYYVQLKLGRFIQWADGLGLICYINALNRDSEGVSEQVKSSLWIVLQYLTLFYNFFIFDMYGRVIGYPINVALFVMLMIVAPVLLWLILWDYTYILNRINVEYLRQNSFEFLRPNKIAPNEMSQSHDLPNNNLEVNEVIGNQNINVAAVRDIEVASHSPRYDNNKTNDDIKENGVDDKHWRSLPITCNASVDPYSKPQRRQCMISEDVCT
jgi:hypothetical protein